MSKKAQKSAAGSAVLDSEALAAQRPLSANELTAVLELHCMPKVKGSNFNDPWDDNCTTSWGLLIVGPKGGGKSQLVADFANRNNMDFRRVMMGEANDLDSTGALKTDKDGFVYDDTGHHQFTLPKHLPISPPKNGRGIAFIDEAGTGSHMDQNRIASLLTAGYKTGYYGHLVKAGWYWVAATNPDEVDYHLNMQLDLRVRDRFTVVYYSPTSEEIIYHLQSTNKIPDTLTKFLLMNTGLMGAVSARKWEQLGQYVARWEALRNLTIDQFVNFLSLELPTETAAAFGTFLRIGDNPAEYPILAKNIAAADEAHHKDHVRIVEQWMRNGNRASLIAATGHDIAQFMGDSNNTFDAKAVRNLLSVIEKMSGMDDLVFMICSSAFKNNRSKDLIFSEAMKSDVKPIVTRVMNAAAGVGRPTK